jgi:ABC-type methionine transport system permease subunit
LFVAEAEELTETVIVFVKAQVIVNPWRQTPYIVLSISGGGNCKYSQ